MSRTDKDELVTQFVRLTRPCHERLFRIALSLCGDRDQAADLTQEALIRAFRAFDRFRLGAPVLPWLARILRNHYLDTLKTGRVRHELSESQMGGGDELARAGAVPSPIKQIERAQLMRWLQQELESLPEDQRLIVLLCDVEGMSYKEAAEVAGVPVGTVRSRLSRCREVLRNRITARMAEPSGRNHLKNQVGTNGRSQS